MEKSWIAPILSNSLDDLNEFADAEETVSAPTELLAEFLHSIMVKDYEKALGYCNEILSYEPDYAIVKEFRPIIEEKLEMLRNEESEGGSSNSSSSLSSSTSGSLENLHSTKDKTNWDAGSFNLSSLGSDDETNKTSRTRAAANGNTETHSPSSTGENSTENKDAKTISTSATRTILNAKLLAHKTRTRVLRRDGDNHDQNSETDRLTNENSSTLLRSTNTRVFKKDNFPEPEKDNNSRTFAWFSSLQENFFGSKKRERSGSKKSDQNSRKATNDDDDDDDDGDDDDDNNNNAKGKKTGKETKTIQNKHAIK